MLKFTAFIFLFFIQFYCLSANTENTNTLNFEVLDETGASANDYKVEVLWQFADKKTIKEEHTISDGKPLSLNISNKIYGHITFIKDGYTTTAYGYNPRNEIHSTQRITFFKGHVKKIQIIDAATLKALTEKIIYFQFYINDQPITISTKTNQDGYASIRVSDQYKNWITWCDGKTLQYGEGSIEFVSKLTFQNESTVSFALNKEESFEDINVSLMTQSGEEVLKYPHPGVAKKYQRIKHNNDSIQIFNLPADRYHLSLTGKHTKDHILGFDLKANQTKVCDLQKDLNTRIQITINNAPANYSAEGYLLYGKTNTQKGYYKNGSFEFYIDANKLNETDELFFFCNESTPVNIYKKIQDSKNIKLSLDFLNQKPLQFIHNSNPVNPVGFLSIQYNFNRYIINTDILLDQNTTNKNIQVGGDVKVEAYFYARDFSNSKIINIENQNTLQVALQKRDSYSFICTDQNKTPLRNLDVTVLTNSGWQEKIISTNSDGNLSITFDKMYAGQTIKFSCDGYLPLKIELNPLKNKAELAFIKSYDLKLILNNAHKVSRLKLLHAQLDKNAHIGTPYIVRPTSIDGQYELTIKNLSHGKQEIKLESSRYKSQNILVDISKEKPNIKNVELISNSPLEFSFNIPTAEVSKSSYVTLYGNSIETRLRFDAQSTSPQILLPDDVKNYSNLRVQIPGYLPSKLISIRELPTLGPLKVILNKGTDISLKIIDDTSNIVEKATVTTYFYVDNESYYRQAETNIEGIAIINNLPIDAKFKLQISKPGFTRKEILILSSQKNATLAIERALTVIVEHQNPASRFDTDANLRMFYKSASGSGSNTTQISSKNGRYEFYWENCENTHFNLIIPGYEITPSYKVIPSKDRSVIYKTSIKKVLPFKIFVTTNKGEILTNAYVSLQNTTNEVECNPNNTNKSQGEFTFLTINDGEWRVNIHQKDYLNFTSTIKVNETKREFTFALTKSYSLWGKLISETTGKEMPQVEGSIYFDGSEKRYYINTNKKGFFQINQLESMPEIVNFKMDHFYEKKHNINELKKMEGGTTTTTNQEETITAYCFALSEYPKIKFNLIDYSPAQNEEISVKFKTEKGFETVSLYSKHISEKTLWVNPKYFDATAVSLLVKGYTPTEYFPLNDIKNNDHTFDVTLSKGLVINGKVTDQAGKVIENVSLTLSSLYDDGSQSQYINSKNGDFQFSGLVEGVKSRLTAIKVGYISEQLEFKSVSELQSNLLIVLKKSKKITLSFAETETVQEKSILIELYKSKEASNDNSQNIYPVNGIFSFYLEDNLSKFFKVIKPGFRPSAFYEISNDFDQNHKVSLIKGDIVTFNIVDEKLTPITKIRGYISLVVEGLSEPIELSNYSETNILKFDTLQPGKLTVKIINDDFMDFNQVYNVEEIKDSEQVIILKKGHQIKGIVKDSSTNNPIPNLDINFSFNNQSFRGYTRSNNKGEFTLKKLTSVPTKMTVSSGNYLATEIPEGFNPENLEIYLSNGAQLKIFLNKELKKGSYASVNIMNGPNGSLSYSRSITTDNDESYVLLNALNSGTYQVKVSAKGFIESESFEVTLNDNRTTEHHVILKKMHKLVLKTNASKEDRFYADFYNEKSERTTGSSVFNENNELFIYINSEKDYFIQLTSDKYLASDLIPIQKDGVLADQIPYDFDQGLRITGFVKDENGVAVSNAGIGAQETETYKNKHNRTNAFGFYQITGLLPGQYKITASHDDFIEKESYLPLTDANKNTELNITLLKGKTITFGLKEKTNDTILSNKNFELTLFDESLKRQSHKSIASDAKGFITLSGLEPETKYLILESKGFAHLKIVIEEIRGKETFFILSSESRITANIKAEKASIEYAYLQYSDQVPINDKMVKINSTSQKSAQNGVVQYEINGLNTGSYYLQLTLNDTAISEIVRVDLTEGEHKVIEITPINTGTVFVFKPEDQTAELPDSIKIDFEKPNGSHGHSPRKDSNKTYSVTFSDTSYTHVTIQVKGYLKSNRIPIDFSSNKQEILIPLKKGVTHNLKVVTDSGKPVSGVQAYYLLTDEASSAKPIHAFYGTTDEKGLIVSDQLIPGTYSLQLWKGKANQIYELGLIDQAKTEEIILNELASIQGIAILEGTEEPIQDKVIQLYYFSSSNWSENSWNLEKKIKLNRLGEFDFNFHSKKGRYLIDVEGYTPLELKGNADFSKLIFSVGFTLKVKVTNPLKLNYKDLKISATLRANENKGPEKKISTTYQATDDEIQILFSGIEKGVLTYLITGQGFKGIYEKIIVEESKEIELQMAVEQFFELKFQNDAKVLPSNIEVIFKSISNSATHFVYKQKEQYLIKRDQSLDEYDTFSVKAPGYIKSKAHTFPKDPNILFSDLIQLSEEMQATLIVKDLNGIPVSAMKIEAEHIDKSGFKTHLPTITTSSEGKAILKEIEPGDFNLSLTPNGGSSTAFKTKINITENNQTLFITSGNYEALSLQLADAATSQNIINKRVLVYGTKNQKSYRTFSSTDSNGILILNGIDKEIEEISINVYGYATVLINPHQMENNARILFDEDAILELLFECDRDIVKNAHLMFGNNKTPDFISASLFRSTTKIAKESPRTHQWEYRGLKEGTYTIKVKPNDFKTSQEYQITVIKGQKKSYYFTTELQDRIHIIIPNKTKGGHLNYILSDGITKSASSTYESKNNFFIIYIPDQTIWTTIKLKLDGYEESEPISVGPFYNGIFELKFTPQLAK